MRKLLLLLIGLSVLIMFILFKTDYSKLAIIINYQISWSFYFFLCILAATQLVFRSIRFKYLLARLFEKKISFPYSFMLTSASFFLALVTPNKAGDLFRGFLMKKNFWEITAVSLNEYFLDILIVIIIPGAGLLFGYKHYKKEILIVYFILFTLGIFLLIYLKLKKKLNNSNWYKKREKKFRLLKISFIKFVCNYRLLSMGFLITGLFYGIYFIIFYLVLLKLGASTSFYQTVISASVGVLVGALTFIPMGIGTRDISSYSILALYGTAPEIAISAVIVVRSLSFVFLLVGSLCYVVTIYKFE